MRESMNIGYLAPKIAVYNGLIAIALGKKGRINRKPQKWKLHLARTIHNALNMPHEAR